MKIAIVGLWHLGSVTAACVAKNHDDVLAFDENPFTIQQLQKGQAPLFEPELNELIQYNLQQNKIVFSDNYSDLHDADVVWVTYDTPVDDDDHADVEYVFNQIEKLFPHLQTNAILLISSQLPVGTVKRLENLVTNLYSEKRFHFAYSPENLRLGKAIEVFENAERIVIGIRDEETKTILTSLLQPFTANLLWMSVESAEMTKHAINAFLATSVVFANEIATLCEAVGADAFEVEQGLKSEQRIGQWAYLKPGNAFAGGTLARDVQYLIDLAKDTKRFPHLLSAIMTSNLQHRHWACQKLGAILGNLQNKTIALLGLTYKPGTDTLRRSTAIEIANWCVSQGAVVKVFDPLVKQPSTETANFSICESYPQALDNADAVIVATEHPEFKNISVQEFINLLAQPVILDGSGFLKQQLATNRHIHYCVVGRESCK